MSFRRYVFTPAAVIAVLALIPVAAAESLQRDDLTGTLWFGQYDDTGFIKALEFREDGVLAAYIYQYSRGVHPLAKLGTWQRANGAVKAQIEHRDPQYNRYFEASVVNGKLVGTVHGETPGRQYIERTVVDGKPVNTIREDPPSPWTKDFSFTPDPPCAGERLICDNRIFCVDPERKRSLRPIPGLTAPPSDGVEDFERFQATFLCVAEMGLADDYAERIRFPLAVTTLGLERPRGPDNPGKEPLNVSRAEFSKNLVYDENSHARGLLAPFGSAFAGTGEKAAFWSGRVLVFGRSAGRWMLTESHYCRFGFCPRAMCGESKQRLEFPGPGTDGKEDFHAFYEVFYCNAQPLLSQPVADRDDALIQSRVRYPLRSRSYAAYEPELGAEEHTQEQGPFWFDILYSHDGGNSPPRIRVKGDEAWVTIHSMASSMSTTANFQRIDGLWYLVGYDSTS